MSPLTRKCRYSIALAGIVFAWVATPLTAFASDGESSSPEAACVAQSAMPQADAPQPTRWLLAGAIVVGLVVLAGAAGSLAGSIAHLAGWAAAIPGAVAGIGLGAALYTGGVIAAASGSSASGGATTSTLSSLLSLLFGSTGSGSTGSVVTGLVDQLSGSFVAGTLTTLGVLVGIGVAAIQYLRRRPPGALSPLGGALGGLLGLGIALGVAGGFSIVVSNETTSEVTMVDVTTTQAADSVVPESSGGEIPPGVSSVDSPEAGPAATPVPTASPTVAVPQPAASPTVTVLQPANCRFGPGTVYPVATSFVQGAILPITGRNRAGTWWQVSCAGSPGLCWLSHTVVTPSGDTSGVPIVADPPTSVPTEPPSAPPRQEGTEGCLVTHQGEPSVQVCEHHVCGPNDPRGSVPCWY